MPTDGFATDHVYIGAEIQDLAAGHDGAFYFTWRLNTGAAQIVAPPGRARPPPIPPTPAVIPSPVATPVVIAPSFTG